MNLYGHILLKRFAIEKNIYLSILFFSISQHNLYVKLTPKITLYLRNFYYEIINTGIVFSTKLKQVHDLYWGVTLNPLSFRG